jgi:hypothetical protein
MASPNLSEIVTTTLRNRSKTLSDNMSNHNALLRRLRENGNQTSVTGRDIVRELEYADNGTVQFYSGYETLDVSPSDVLSVPPFLITSSLLVTSQSLVLSKSKTQAQRHSSIFLRHASTCLKSH